MGPTPGVKPRWRAPNEWLVSDYDANGMALTRRVLSAVPDMAAAGLYLWCWIAPLAWQHQFLGLLTLALLIEFVALQAVPFIGNILYGGKMGLDRTRRLRHAAALGTVYLVFAGLAAGAFDAWFPAWIFAWLLAAKVYAALLTYDPGATGREAEMTVWILSASFYFAASFLTFFAPVPNFGVTEGGDTYGLRGMYEWANFPAKPMATGFLYFCAVALMRVFGVRASVDLS